MKKDCGPGVALLLLYPSGGATLVLGPREYSDARCPICDRIVMHVPWGKVNVRILKQRADATGVGPIVMCRSCREYMEVIAQ